MDKSLHAFADTREVTTYTMLRRVLQNHCTTHVMSLLAALTSAVLLLAGTCVQLCKAGGVEEGTLMQQMLAGLKKRVRTRAFTELQSHYLFADRFGRPGKGNDKGKVEGLVKCIGLDVIGRLSDLGA